MAGVAHGLGQPVAVRAARGDVGRGEVTPGLRDLAAVGLAQACLEVIHTPERHAGHLFDVMSERGGVGDIW